MLYHKTYNEQNYVFSKLMKVGVTPSGKREVSYTIPTLGVVCKTAFRKCYGISDSKIRVLLKKMDLAGPSIELDKRGRTNPRRLLPEARHKVIDFILSHEASESHYCRARTHGRKYTCKYTSVLGLLVILKSLFFNGLIAVQARNQGGCTGCVRTLPTGPKSPHFDTQYPS